MGQEIASLSARRGYHHGNLEEALIEAARLLVAEKGVAAFALADAARLAGVTPAAVYRHFADRTALLNALAARGFTAFAAALKSAMESSAHGKDAFSAMGDAYLDFARREPGYYAAMFMSGLNDVDRAGRDAGSFNLLVEGMARALPAPVADPVAVAMQIWALSHGVATLERAGAFGMAGKTVSPNETLRLGGIAIIVGAAR
jgi:AcrR family transcriptional regulator